MVPTHWQLHLPVPWWTTNVHRWGHVHIVSSFPPKQTLTFPSFQRIFYFNHLFTQSTVHTLLSLPIPWHWSLLHSLPAFLTSTKPGSNSIPSPLYPTPCPPSPWSLPHVSLCLLPSLEEKVQILTWMVFRQQLLGAEQAGLPPLTETSYHLPHDFP